MWTKEIGLMLLRGIGESIYMTVFATLFAYLLGVPGGVALVVLAPGGIRPMPRLYAVLNVVINIIRSVPFLILMMTLTPLTRLLVGSPIGTNAAMVSLVIAAAPFVARLVESSLKELDYGITEAALSMGCSRMQIVTRVWLPEAKPSLINGMAIACVTILGYSTMAGVLAGGGLGDIAIRYGWQRYRDDIMLVTVVLLIVIVQILQEIGLRLSRKINHARTN